MPDIESNRRVDILFITHLMLLRGIGKPEVYTPLRMKLGDHIATIPVLQAASGNSGVQKKIHRLMLDLAKRGGPPVLTPFFLKDYMRRRNIVLKEIPCLETGYKEVEDAVKQGVGVIAISTTWLPGSFDAEEIRKAVFKLKQIAPDVPIIAGGVGVRKGLRSRQLMAEGRIPNNTAVELARNYLLIDSALDKDIDAIVISEGGEATLAAIAKRIKNGKDFRDLPNLALPSNDSYQFTERVPEYSDFNNEIVDWNNYAGRLGGLETPIRTAVGCPFNCGFCDFASLYKPGLRSIESLTAEIETLSKTGPGPHPVFFTDDNIAINRKRLLNFTRALIKRKANLAWRAFIRADAVDAETAALMRESGCRESLLGIESGDAGILENMNKRLTPDMALNAVRLLDANGISTQSTFVVGFPGENSHTIENTSSFISSFPSGETARALHRYYLFSFQVFPLCPVATPEQRKKFGLKGIGDKWVHNTMSSEETMAAVKTIFTSVKGPSHMYLEFSPPDWPVAETRRVMETRDEIQKSVLEGADVAGDVERLLQTVAEIDTKCRKKKV